MHSSPVKPKHSLCVNQHSESKVQGLPLPCSEQVLLVVHLVCGMHPLPKQSEEYTQFDPVPVNKHLQVAVSHLACGTHPLFKQAVESTQLAPVPVKVHWQVVVSHLVCGTHPAFKQAVESTQLAPVPVVVHWQVVVSHLLVTLQLQSLPVVPPQLVTPP